MSTVIQSRPFGHPRDEENLCRLAATAAQQSRLPIPYLHPGDVCWRLYRTLDFDPRTHIRLWETPDGALLACAWFHHTFHSVDLMVHPQHTAALTPRLLRWVEQQAGRRTTQTASPAIRQLRVGCHQQDQQRRQILQQHGYRPDLFYYLHFQQAVSAPRPFYLPAGFCARSVRPDEYPARARLHAAAFHPSPVTPAGYQRVMRSIGYTADLDVVIENEDGRLVAFALCWLDEQTGTGLFEPIGTHPDYRRLGLGRAVIQAALNRLHTHGARRAWLYTESANHPAQRLYAAVGFHVVGKQHDYVKSLP